MSRQNGYTPDSRAMVPFTTVEEAVGHIHGEWMLSTYDDAAEYTFWPAGGQLVVKMSNLPSDELADKLARRIRDHFEAKQTVGGNTYTKFPVALVRIDAVNDLVTVIADKRRIHETCPRSVLRPN